MARFVEVQVRSTLSGATFPPCATIVFLPAGSSATSSAQSTDLLVSMNEGRLLSCVGYKFISTLGITIGAAVHVAPIEW